MWFSILTLHLQLHANEISKVSNNSNYKESSIFNVDQSKIKYATLALNNSQEKEYGEFYPEYNGESLEYFLQEHPEVGKGGNDFKRFLDSRPEYRMRRCPPRIQQNYFNIKNANNEKGGVVRRSNKASKARPWNKQCFDDSATSRPTKTKSENQNLKTSTSHTLFNAKIDALSFNQSESLVLKTECKIDSKRSLFEAESMRPSIESNYPLNHYLNKGGKVQVPNLPPLTTFFFQPTKYVDKTKHFYDPNKSTKAISKSDIVPWESYLFHTTTPKVLRVKGSHATDNLLQNESLNNDNISNIVPNESSLKFEKAIDKYSLFNLLRYNNVGEKMKRNDIGDHNNAKRLIANAIFDKRLAKMTDSLASTNQFDSNLHFDESKLVLTSTSGNIISVKNSLNNGMEENGRNDLRYFTDNKEKNRSKNQQESVFVSEKDYISQEKDRRNINDSKNLKGKNTFANHQNIDSPNNNVNISIVKRSICKPQAKNLEKEGTEIKKINYSATCGDGSNISVAVHSSGGIYYYPDTAPIVTKNVLNQNLSPVSLHKRKVSEENKGPKSSNLLNNAYDDYDYYFIIGDNNTDESPLQNYYKAMNVRTEKDLVEKSDSNYKTASNTLENNISLGKKNKNISKSKSNSTIAIHNNNMQYLSTMTPNIIKKFWPNVGNREKLSLLDGKNYILNLFRRKGNGSTKRKKLSSSTTSQTMVKNFFFNKRSNSNGSELKEIDRKALLEDFASNIEYYRGKRTSNEDTSNSIKSYNTSLPPARNVKSFSCFDDLTMDSAAEELNNQSVLQKFQSNDEKCFKDISDIIGLLQKVERPKRKSAIVNKDSPEGLLPQNKHLRRSIVEMEDYNVKFQNLQKDLLELQKAISSPKASRVSRNEEKNLTLQIRVIVDVVNNSLGVTENPEDEQLIKRDTKLVEKKSNLAKLDIPMPLEHDSPLVEEKKGTDVWRNKRVDCTVNEAQTNSPHITDKENSLNDLPDDIIKNITYLLDNLLENYKLQDRNRKINVLHRSGTANPEYEDQKLKHSFIHLRKSPSFNLKTYNPIITGDYNFSSGLGDSKNQYLKDVTEANNNNLLMEIKKLLPSEMFNLLSIRNRRSTNEKQSQKIFKDYNNKLFQDEINALYNIIENIKKQLALKKKMDSMGEEDNLISEFLPFQKIGSTSEMSVKDNTLNKNKKDLHTVKYSHSINDAKIDEILETIENIGKELKQIDSKDKFLQGILNLETKNHMNRNKKKTKMKKNKTTLSSLRLLSKAVNAKPTKNKKNSKETEIKKKKHKHTTLRPCCETTIVDEGNHLSIEWCCPNEEIKSNLKPTNSLSKSSDKSSTSSTTESNNTPLITSTSTHKTKHTEEESKTSSTQNTKEIEGNTYEEIKSSTHTTSLDTKSTIPPTHTTRGESVSTSSIQTKHEESTIHSTTKTTKHEESKVLSNTQTKKDEESTILSTTQTTKDEESTILSTTQTTKDEESTILSTTQTTKDEESTILSTTQTTKYEESTILSTTQTTKTHKKRNHIHGHKKTHSQYKENLHSGKYIPQSVEESFQYFNKYLYR